MELYYVRDETLSHEQYLDHRTAIVEAATELLGCMAIKYIHGRPDLGQSPDTGFDCSGFVTYVLHTVGLPPPDYLSVDAAIKPIRHANEYWDHYGISVHHGQQLPGDLIIFSRNGYFPSHIGIVRDPESYIHSPGLNNSKVEVKPIIMQPKVYSPQADRPRIVFTSNIAGYKSPTRKLSGENYRYAIESI